MITWFLQAPRPQKRALSVVADVFFICFALWASISIRLELFYKFETNTVYYSFFVTLLITLVAFVKVGLYRAVIRYLSNHALIAVVSSVTFSALAFAASSFLFDAPIPRSAPLIYWALALIFVGGSRLMVRSYVHSQWSQAKEKVLIYGAGASGLQLATALAQGTELRPVAFVDDSPKMVGNIVQGLRVYSPGELGRVIVAKKVGRILLALGDAPNSQRAVVLRYLEHFSLQVQTIPSLADVLAGRANIEEIKDVEIEDLLGRDPIDPDNQLLHGIIESRVVMVTGAGGSIGSELCRQILLHRPRKLILFELSEFALYSIDNELKQKAIDNHLDVEIVAVMGSVQKRRRLEMVMKAYKVDTLYHAAAYKHVPLVEHNVLEGMMNNVFGTWYAAEAAMTAHVKNFVLISTDKAVRPTNIMGATKRLAELILQGLAKKHSRTKFCMVRFGNVLGSSGSVVPLFRQQISAGGPITVTHPDIIRYFMTIPEAAQLVLQAGSIGKGGEVFVLDMGEQVKIADLARKMIHLMGREVKDEHNPEGDIEIKYTGLRPGEKLFEELLIGDSPQGTNHPRIMKAKELSLPWDEIQNLLDQLKTAANNFDCDEVCAIMRKAPLGYCPQGKIEDSVWKQSKAEEQDISLANVANLR